MGRSNRGIINRERIAKNFFWCSSLPDD